MHKPSFLTSSEWETDRIQALNRAPKDVSGAGDSLLVAATLALTGRSNIWEAAALGSIAAAVQVSRSGNIPLADLELINALNLS